MTVAFQSFNRSPLGAFIKSPLGARGSGGAYDFLAWHSGSETEVHHSDGKGNWSKDTVNNNTGFYSYFMKAFFNDLWHEMWGTYNSRSNDGVLTRVENTAITGSGGQFSRVIDIDGRLGMTYHAGSGVTPKFYYSDDDGNSWSSVNVRSATEASLAARPIILKLASGRLITFSRNYHGSTSPVGTNFFCNYSDDDGASWSEVLVYNYASSNLSTAPGWAWVTSGGRIVLVGAPDNSSGKKSFYSDDDGETWSNFTHDLPDFYAADLTKRQVHVMDSGRVFISGAATTLKVWYTDDDGDSFTELGGGPLLKIENRLYRFKSCPNKTRTIEKSDDEGDSWSDHDTVTTMTTDNYGLYLRSKYEETSFL